VQSDLLENVVSEIAEAVVGRLFGRVFQLSRFESVIDLRIDGGRYLFIIIEPATPRIYLVKRRLRELEKQSINPTPFGLLLKRYLSNAEVTAVERVVNERVLLVDLAAADEMGETRPMTLAIQLTGRSANMFLLDERRVILGTARRTDGDGQEVGDAYSPPARPAGFKPLAGSSTSVRGPEIAPEGSPSEQLDRYYQEKAERQQFESLARTARNTIERDISKLEKLAANLKADMAAHGDADKWKRFGDLLLANVGTAERSGGAFLVTDLFDEDQPRISIEAEENESVTAAAERYFRRYTRSRNAGREIAARLTEAESGLERLCKQNEAVEAAVEARDEEALAAFAGKRTKPARDKQAAKIPATQSFARSFVSSDGFEILVGKRAKDNDHLTFRSARSLDTWMHAADYPGSHVVIRNPNRKEIPPRTLLEAAQLAAFYSQGKKQPKAAVHYTLKKFVNKPRGAAPGLVSLSSFKTLLVEPAFPDLGSD
jgi:predicted ribosome quality control (RQC) complex YloA/Tae2 family protein